MSIPLPDTDATESETPRSDYQDLLGNQATPNVRIESPKARKIIGNIFGYASLTLAAVVVVDGAIGQLDLLWLTAPAGTILLGLFGLYQTVITSPNVPTA